MLSDTITEVLYFLVILHLILSSVENVIPRRACLYLAVKHGIYLWVFISGRHLFVYLSRFLLNFGLNRLGPATQRPLTSIHVGCHFDSKARQTKSSFCSPQRRLPCTFFPCIICDCGYVSMIDPKDETVPNIIASFVFFFLMQT